MYEVQESEGHGEQAEEDVGESHVGDQDVPGGLHQLISEWYQLKRMFVEQFLLHLIQATMMEMF